jgi:hypothetical protein
MRDDHRVHTYNVKYLLILMINSSPIHELTNDIVLILSAHSLYAHNISYSVTPLSYHHSVMIQHLISNTLYNDIVLILSATVLHGTVHKHLLHISQKEV